MPSYVPHMLHTYVQINFLYVLFHLFLGITQKKISLGGRNVLQRKITKRRLSRNGRKWVSFTGLLHVIHRVKTHPVNQNQREQKTQNEEKKNEKICVVQPEKNVSTKTHRFSTFHISLSGLRWMFILIFLYIIAGTVIVMITNGAESIRNTIMYSIMGFFTFFMSYFGWWFACTVRELVSRAQVKDDMQS